MLTAIEGGNAAKSCAPAPVAPALMNDIGLVVARADRAEDSVRRLRYRLFGPQPESANSQLTDRSIGEYAEGDIVRAARTLQAVLDLLEEVEARLG